jgi:hypothetical protein
MNMNVKRMFGFMVAVLFAATVFGCSYETPAEEETVQYDEQGRRLVSFSVPTKGYEITGGGEPMLGP